MEEQSLKEVSKKNVPLNELAEAFKPEKKSKKKLAAIVIMIVGLLTLAAGIIFSILKLNATPAIQDGEFLISAKEWVLNDNANCNSDDDQETNCTPSVIWKFTEIGKGTLTTNNHINDYDFSWAIKDKKLQIETAWLYDLENEYDYELNQNDKTLTLKNGEEEFNFTAVFETE